MTRKFRLELVKQFLTLSTASFGLVAALAWNSAIQTLINDYVKPYIPNGGSAILSQLVYATIISLLVFTITYYLSSLKEKLESES